MKMIRTNAHVALPASHKVYICKSWEEADVIAKLAETTMPQSKDWYRSIMFCEVIKDCRVPTIFHDHGYWMVDVEHNNGDWENEQTYELYVVD